METPSLREIELETLLRERESQLADLTDEVSQLRRFIINQPISSGSDPVSLPPALMALLQAHMKDEQSQGTQSSSTMTTALLQRTRVLQEENDELYQLLRTVSKLERALKESHSTVSSLSDELDKAYSSFLAQQKFNDTHQLEHESRSPSREQNRSAPTDSPRLSNNGDLKSLPTGPRAHKKPRLSENSRPSPAHSPAPNLSHSNSNSNTYPSRRERSPRDERRSPTKEARMDTDEDIKTARDRSRDRGSKDKQRDRNWSKERSRDHRERDRGRDRDSNRQRVGDKDRERDRDRDRSRRNESRGSHGHGGHGVYLIMYTDFLFLSYSFSLSLSFPFYI
ncbi:hypothetical protein PNOK_0358300 [Pyrrhoderma noxium]|uniref:Uncharacterized protein n=1 Tax=Pyrrhoderma noxium TaxID=2282107 RepID=A0A286UMY0_9AGAM|nr:hypothetical protein PNOK_0358300 [Pyrrhoderma noxium]